MDRDPAGAPSELVQRQKKDREPDDVTRDGIDPDSDGPADEVLATIMEVPDKDSPSSLRAEAYAVLVHLHGDEEDALAAAVNATLTRKVNMVYLKRPQSAPADRLIYIRVGGKLCSADPNRIFTDNGLTSTLKYAKGMSAAEKETALRLLTEFAERLYATIERNRKPEGRNGPPLPVIGLHNNSDGGLSYDHPEKGEISVKTKRAASSGERFSDPDNFILVTNADDLDLIAPGGRAATRQFNVLLQAANTKNDGSLSVRIIRNSSSDTNASPARANERYFNVEAQSGKAATSGASPAVTRAFDTNRAMIVRLLDLLGVPARPQGGETKVVQLDLERSERVAELLRLIADHDKGR